MSNLNKSNIQHSKIAISMLSICNKDKQKQQTIKSSICQLFDGAGVAEEKKAGRSSFGS